MTGTLKFLADECCDAGLVSTLRDSGYDVTYITEQCAGASDDEVLLRAYNECRTYSQRIKILASFPIASENRLQVSF
jgi:hypothetical protein